MTNGKNNYIPFLRPKAIYLGLKIEEKHEKYIKDLCDLYNIPVYKMIKDKSNYNMDYDKI